MSVEGCGPSRGARASTTPPGPRMESIEKVSGIEYHCPSNVPPPFTASQRGDRGTRYLLGLRSNSTTALNTAYPAPPSRRKTQTRFGSGPGTASDWLRNQRGAFWVWEVLRPGGRLCDYFWSASEGFSTSRWERWERRLWDWEMVAEQRSERLQCRFACVSGEVKRC